MTCWQWPHNHNEHVKNKLVQNDGVGESTLQCRQKTITIWQFLILMELWYIMVDVWKTFCN